MLNLVTMLAVRELRTGWRLYLALTVLVITAAAMISLAPIFRLAMGDLALQRQLDAQPPFTSELRIDRYRQPADAAAFAETRALIDGEVETSLQPVVGATARAAATGVAPLRFPGELTEMRAYFQLFQGLSPHVDRDEGGAPGNEPGAVAVSRQAAEELGIAAGDDLLFLAPDADEPIALHVSGILTAAEGSDPYFLGVERWFDVVQPGPMEGGGPIIGLFIEEEAYLRDIAPLVGDFRIAHFVRVALQADRLHGEDVARTRGEIDDTVRALNAIDGVVARSPLADALRRYESQERFNTTSTFIITIQFAGVALFAVVLLGREAARRTRADRYRLRVRGASTRQMVAGQALVGAIVAAPALGLAAPIAAFGLAQAGGIGALGELTDGGALDTRMPPIAWGLAGLGAFLSWLAFTTSGWLEARQSIVEEQRRIGRPQRLSLLHRYYLDVAILLVGGLLFFQFRNEAEGGELSALQRGDFDVLLLAGPGLLLLGVALVLVRLVPVILAWGARVAGAARVPAWMLLGLLQPARNPGRAVSLLILVLFVSAVGALAASYEETIRSTAEDRIRYEAGAELRAVGVTAPNAPERAARPLENHPGIKAAGVAFRGFGGLGDVTSGSRVQLLALQAGRFAELLPFRDDYADAELAEILAAIEAEPGTPGVILPTGAERVSVWVRTAPADAGLWVEARVSDGGGRVANVRLGMPTGEWSQLSAPLVIRGGPPVEPVHLVALTLRNAAPTVRFPSGSAWFDDLTVTVGDDAVLVEDFDSAGRWFAGSGSRAGADTSATVASPSRDGDPVAEYGWAGLRGGEERQLAAISPNIPVKGAMDRASLEAADLELGDVVPVALQDYTLPVRLVAETDLFPTLDPRSGAMVVVDIDALQRAATAFSARPIPVTEIWARTGDEAAHAAVRAFILATYFPSVLLDAETLLADERADPFGPAGAGVVFVVGLAGLAIVGIVATLILFAAAGAERAREGAILSAIGYGPLATLGQAAMEAGLILIAGAGLGLLLGRQVASSMLAFLDVTPSGDEAVPPFLLATDWPVAALGIAVLVLAGILGVLLLANLDRQVPAGATLRNADL